MQASGICTVTQCTQHQSCARLPSGPGAPQLPRRAVSYLLDADPEPLLPTGLRSSSSHRLSGRTSSRGRLPI